MGMMGVWWRCMYCTNNQEIIDIIHDDKQEVSPNEISMHILQMTRLMNFTSNVILNDTEENIGYLLIVLKQEEKRRKMNNLSILYKDYRQSKLLFILGSLSVLSSISIEYVLLESYNYELVCTCE